VQLLNEDRAALLMGQPFLAMLAMQLPIVAVVDPRLCSATTDGNSLFVNAPFVIGLGTQQRRFLLAHVVWHCALLHLWRRGERDCRWWDLAIDHEVNAILQEYLPVPEDSVLFDEHIGENAEQVYQWLVAAGEPRTRGRLADLHARRAVLPAAQGEPELPAPPPASATAPSCAGPDPEYAPLVKRDGRRVWAERVLIVATQIERTRGHLPPALRRLVEQLRRPQLDWREVLRQFVVSMIGDQRIWLPPSRRHLHQGLYLPSRHEQAVRLVVALDTSASTQALQHVLLSELVGIVEAYGRYELLLVQGDARVQSVADYSQDEPLDVRGLELRGFGGTDFRPVFSYLSEQAMEVSALVFLTDGMGTAPESAPGYPVLWVLTAA
jgi:predicted metal-dependent peptidase